MSTKLRTPPWHGLKKLELEVKLKRKHGLQTMRKKEKHGEMHNRCQAREEEVNQTSEVVKEETEKIEDRQISQRKNAITVTKWDIYRDSAQTSKEAVEAAEVEMVTDQDPQLASDARKKGKIW